MNLPDAEPGGRETAPAESARTGGTVRGALGTDTGLTGGGTGSMGEGRIAASSSCRISPDSAGLEDKASGGGGKGAGDSVREV